MARVEGAFQEVIHGVSTVPPRTRPTQYAEQQVNFHCDIVDKLVRRPSLEWVTELLPDPNIVQWLDSKYLKFNRGNRDHEFIIGKYYSGGEVNNVVEVWVDGTKVSTLTDSALLYGDLEGIRATYIGDSLIIVDTTTKVDYEKFTYQHPDFGETTENYVDDHPVAGTYTERVTHVNAIVAGEYGEVISLILTLPDGTELPPVEYYIPEFGSGDNDTLQQRATSYIVEALELLIANNLWGLTYGIYTAVEGSTLSIWLANTDGSALDAGQRESYGWIKAAISTGQGDESIVCINESIEKAQGLPLYAVPGTVVKVRPSPTSDDGAYYLKAEPVDVDYTLGAHGREMEEVVWEETHSPTEPNRIDVSTMPTHLTYDEDANTYSANQVGWKSRPSGDDESCPPPVFLENNLPILDVGLFQNRLVLLTANEVVMSETDDLENFWKQSAVQLLVTDPVGISSSAKNIDKLAVLAEHNRDLFIGAKNGQFKIAGKVAVSPQTVSMQLTTDYSMAVSPRPVGIGESLYLPMTFGDSAGLHEYTGRENTDQDTAFNVASHIRGYIQGDIELLVSSPNLEIVVAKATGNTLYVFNQHTRRNGQVVQQAWYKWELETDGEVVSLHMNNATLDVVTKLDERVFIKRMNLRSSNAPEVIATSYSDTGLKDIYLDDHIVVDTPDGITVTIPQGYTVDDDTVVVRGAGTNYPRTIVKYTYNELTNTMTLEEQVGLGSLEIGTPFTSSFIPTRPFRRDGEGVPITSDRVRISQYRVSVVESYELWMHIISDYYSGADQEFNSRVMNANNNLIGYAPHTTDDVLFGFSQDVKYAMAEFYTDGFLALNIDGITWRGQFYQSSRRM